MEHICARSVRGQRLSKCRTRLDQQPAPAKSLFKELSVAVVHTIARAHLDKESATFREPKSLRNILVLSTLREEACAANASHISNAARDARCITRAALTMGDGCTLVVICC
jgi:hypothetical protein